MKKVLSILLCVFNILTLFNTVVFATEDNSDDFWQQVCMMVAKYEEDTYFSTMSVTIGESEIDIDGEIVPIDESNSVPYVENGRTMMPVRGLAEAIGADVSYDDSTQTVTVESPETVVLMTIGFDKMKVNGETVQLLNAPKIVNGRTMLPVRDVAEALDCEVEWIQETETAVFTRPLQTKRIIAYSETAKDSDAVMSVRGHGMTVMQFDSIDDMKEALDKMESEGVTAEPDYVRKIDAMSWGINEIGSEKYYEQVDYASGSATVAVVDTGVDLSHSYFSGRLVKGYDIYDNDNNPQDERGHGTHVASTVLDVAGFNPNIKIMPVKVFGTEDSTYSTTIAAGIEFAVDKGADVINLSVGGQHRSTVEQQAIDYANKMNVAVVAAAGNEKLNLEYYDYSPGGLNGVITVSALNENGELASFSNYGDGIVEFAAPGVNIQGAKLGGGYCSKSGTSMATPHVAGVYALVKAVHPDMNLDDMTEGLKNNTIDKGNARFYGAGEIRVSNLESKLSSVFVNGEMVTDITQTNAVIKGDISYKGIEPEFVGVRIGTSKDNKEDVYTISFTENKNGKMNFVCDLNTDAECVLTSGTKYYASIFMKPAGLDYVSDLLEFTTEEIPEESNPEPEKSELRILPTDYPQGSIEVGNKFYLKGRIKSNFHITDVRSYLLDESKNIVQESSGWTTTATYVIENSRLDVGLKFNQLPMGNYYLQYKASDETGNSVTWTSEMFSVIGSDTGNPELRILPEAYPIGEIPYGKSFMLSGRIKSNYHITDVKAYLLDSNNSIVMEASGWTTTQTYVIEGSALDRGMKFNKLEPGGYYLKYETADESGKTINWTSDIFYVVK